MFRLNMNEPRNATLFRNFRPRVVPLLLSDLYLSNETASRSQDLTEPFFPRCFLHVTRVFFRVMHDRLSERGTIR